MSVPICARPDEESFGSLGWADTLLFLLVLLIACVIIGALTLATWLARFIVSISEDPNASPYRQVR